MCGFAGWAGARPYSLSLLAEMTRRIAHRGPDDEGYYTSQSWAGSQTLPELQAVLPMLETSAQSSFAMGFRRLAIEGLGPGGHQPMQRQHTVLCFNGEVYNFRALRSELASLGYTFQTDGDTEVVQYALLEWGKEALPRLDGMFALAFWDGRKLLLARDRFGLKPLYFHFSGETLFWASEQKAFLPILSFSLNPAGLLENFLYQGTAAPQTCFNEIQALPPGHLLTFDQKGLACQPFYALPTVGETYTEPLEIFELLQQSVQAQTQSPVPTLCLLSGGIDSTLLTTLAPTLPALTLDYGYHAAEIIRSQQFAAQKGLKQTLVPLSPDLCPDTVIADLTHFEAPYPSYEVLLGAMKTAQDLGAKVVLSGNAADEVFGGYAHQLKLQRWKRLRPFTPLANLLPFTGLLGKLKNQLSLKSLEAFYQKGQSAFSLLEMQHLWKEAPFERLKNDNLSENPYETYFQLDMKRSLGAHHTFRDDLSSMRYGVELRYPYLSNRLVDLVARTPLAQRYTSRHNKPLLRQVARPHLPDYILNPEKTGFSFPLNKVVRENKHLESWLLDEIQALKNRNLFEKSVLENYRNAWRQGLPIASKLWQLASTEVFLRNYIKKA